MDLPIVEQILPILLSLFYLSCATGNQSALLTQKECTINCAYKVAFLRENYNDCMFNCTAGNWLLASEGHCIDSPSSYREEDAASVCAPVEVIFHEVKIYNNLTDITNGYLVMSWLPCPAGIDDVKGFQVKFVDKQFFADDCYSVNLTKTLNNANRETRLSIVWPHKLSFQSEIHAIIRPLPITTVDDHKTYSYTSESCVNLNGHGKCVCGLKGLQSSTTAPKVTVQGYTLHVAMPVLNLCFQISGYQLAVTRKSSHNYFFNSIKTKYFQNPKGHFLNYSFFPVYNSPTEDIIKVSCTLIGEGEPKAISSSRIEVKAWIPQPEIEVMSQGVIKVSFRPAADEYKISNYLVRLASHPNAQFDNLSVPTKTRISNLTLADLEGGVLSTTYYDLQPSVYSIQVKEYRPHSAIFSEAEWSKSIETIVEHTSSDKTSSVIISVVLLTGVLTIFVAIFVITMFLWKKGKCSKVRHYLPGHVTQWIDAQTISDIYLQKRTVFIVWQNDTRSHILGGKHAEIIRHLASYLSRVCGLHVILDCLEEHIVGIGASNWIQTSLENAEFVLFVCPHFHNEDDKIVGNVFSPSVVGDFNKVYSYIEPQLGDRKKFITLLLPYSDPTCCKATKWLSSMTRSFKIMDQIEDLYFHIQEHSKVNLSGRHSVRYISCKDYHLTPEGQAFKGCVLSFMEDGLSTDFNESSGTSLEDGEENSRDALLEHQDIDLKNCIGVLPPAPYPTSLPLTIQPPPPLLRHPEEHLQLINALPVNQIDVRVLPVNHAQCPYHSDMAKVEGAQNHPDGFPIGFKPCPSSHSRGSFASTGSSSSYHDSSGRSSALEELNIRGLTAGEAFDLKETCKVEVAPPADSGFAESPT